MTRNKRDLIFSLWAFNFSKQSPFSEVQCGIVSVVNREFAPCVTKRHDFQTWQLNKSHPGQKCDDFIIIWIAQFLVCNFLIVCPFIERKCSYFFFPKNTTCSVNYDSANPFTQIYFKMSSANCRYRENNCGVSLNITVLTKVVRECRNWQKLQFY